MNRTFLRLGTVVVAIVLAMGAIGVAMAAQPGPAYLAVDSFAADAQGQGARLSVTTNADISKMADAFITAQIIVGIAWADLDTGKALVTTIHPRIGRDSLQRPDQWHLHTVQLTPVGPTAPNDFCLVAVTSTPTGGIQIRGSTMQVNVRSSVLPFSLDDIDGAVGFTVEADAGCADTGLAVLVRN